MKGIKIKIGLIVMLLGAFQILNAQKSVLKPKLNNKKVQIKAGKKKQTTYYSLSKKYGTVLKVNGPGEVTIFLRTKMGEDEQVDNSYHIKYILDGKIVKVKPVQKSKVSKKTKIVGKSFNVSVVQKIKIIIPPGKHKLEVFSINNQRKVYSKYYLEKYPKPKWEAQQPIRKAEKVSLVSTKSQKSLEYFRINSADSYKIRVEGNSYLRIFVRGEFKHSMFSDNEIRILMKEDGKILYTFKISSVRSKQIRYANGGKLIPGSLNKIYLQIPPGSHNYEFVVADKSKSALIKSSYDKERFPDKK